jgi:hypothetical protein
LRLITIIAALALSTGTAAAEFARVLVPLRYTDAPGAYGSVWSTDLHLYNGSAVTLRPGIDIFPIVTACPPIPQLVRIEPRTLVELPDCASGRRPPAQLVYVREPAVGTVAFSLRIREVTGSISEQTSVPVVRDEMLFDRPLFLLRVAQSGSRFRSTIRVYAPDAVPTVVTVRLWLGGGRLEPLAERQLELIAPPGGAMAYPSYAELMLDEHSFPMLERDFRELQVEIEPAANVPIWAMASITDNVTQTVHVILPQ